MICVSHELGLNIAKMRKRLGLTQQQLADALSTDDEPVSMHMISAWERATRDIPASRIPDICHVLGCSSFDLYPHSDALDDKDLQLISIIRSLGQGQKDDLYYLLHDWNGDRKALLKLDVIHAVQSADMRHDADRIIINSYIDAVKRGDERIDRRIRTDLDYVRRAFRNLLKED